MPTQRLTSAPPWSHICPPATPNIHNRVKASRRLALANMALQNMFPTLMSVVETADKHFNIDDKVACVKMVLDMVWTGFNGLRWCSTNTVQL